MDTPSTHTWINQVCGPRTLRVGPDMVLLDLGPAHAQTEIIDRIAEFQGYVELLPAHSASVLQVTDVGINKPFKNVVRDEYDLWNEENGDDDKAKPQEPDVANWIIRHGLK
jgi:DDE superfamily endonuclease